MMNTFQPVPASPRGDILILTASTGGGHDSVAAALSEAMHEMAPGRPIRVHDPFAGERAHGPMSLGGCYDAMVAHAPWMWSLMYRVTDNEWAMRLGMAIICRLWAARLRRLLEERRPDIIVSVHPLCTRLAAAVLRGMSEPPPLHCVVTDLVTIHRSWACEAADAFYAATGYAAAALTDAGIGPDRLQMTGLPLRATFNQAPVATSGAARPRVLLLGGARPGRRLEAVARALVESGACLDLVVVCGRNIRLQRRLARALGSRATVLGWRDDIADLMRWSDVVLTKAGPTTIAEALSQARPVMIFEAHPGQEQGNVALATCTGAGCYLPKVKQLVRAISTRQWEAAAGNEVATWWGGAARRVAGSVVDSMNLERVPLTPQPWDDESKVGTGNVIHNPVSGERIIIRTSGAETGGELMRFDLFLPPGGHVPARHVHPRQRERFTVLSGQMRFRLGWRRRTVLVNPGESIEVPAGTAHWFGNAGQGVSHASVEVRPALRMEELFETAAAMEVVGRRPGHLRPHLPDLARFMLEFQRELAVPDLPAVMVRTFLTPLARMGRPSDETKSGPAR
jgi:1,2-diacylglycerol 3-beta-galactosyltransferase